MQWVAVTSSTGTRLICDVDCCFNDAFNEVIWSANHLHAYWSRVFNMRRAPALSFPFPLSTAWFLCSSPPTGGICSQWGSLKKCLFSLGLCYPNWLAVRSNKVIFLARCLANLCKHLRKGRKLGLFPLGNWRSLFQRRTLPSTFFFSLPTELQPRKLGHWKLSTKLHSCASCFILFSAKKKKT